jgi:hypothetical protein
MTRQKREERVRGWLAGRLPDEWFTAPVDLTTDRDEITVIGTLAAPKVPTEASPVERSAAESGRIKEFRERTREPRIRHGARPVARPGRRSPPSRCRS